MRQLNQISVPEIVVVLMKLKIAMLGSQHEEDIGEPQKHYPKMHTHINSNLITMDKISKPRKDVWKEVQMPGYSSNYYFQ